MTLITMLDERYTMQNPNHTAEDKFVMNFGNFDPENLFNSNVPPMPPMNVGVKRSAHEAGLERDSLGLSSDDESELMKKEKNHPSSSRSYMHQQTSLDHDQPKVSLLPNGKKTKGRVKIKMEFIDNKLRRYTTFSKRKTGIMKKAYELSTLTGTQVMLLVASETGHVYTFATRKLQPMITSEAGKALIQTCLNSPDPPSAVTHHHDQRMSATGYEEPELTYAVSEDEHKVRQMMYNSPLNTMHHQNAQMASPSHHPTSLGIQSHHHSQYQPHVGSHLTPPTSLPHHMSQQNNHSDHGLGALNHHNHLGGPATPLPPQSPNPSHSPMGTTSPGSPYTSLHHHPHHPLQTHSR